MSEITYGRLDEVLRSLEFSVHIVDGNTRIYKHEATGALVYLPKFPLTMPALPHHLVMARTTLDLFGVATPMEFTASLLMAAAGDRVQLATFRRNVVRFHASAKRR